VIILSLVFSIFYFIFSSHFLFFSLPLLASWRLNPPELFTPCPAARRRNRASHVGGQLLLPPRAVVVGNPARQIRDVPDDELLG
jgi:hypothetical protein